MKTIIRKSVKSNRQKCTVKKFAIQYPSTGIFIRLGVFSGSNLHHFAGMSVTIMHESPL